MRGRRIDVDATLRKLVRDESERLARADAPAEIKP